MAPTAVKTVRGRTAKRPPPRARTANTGGSKPARGSKVKARMQKS